MRALLLVTLLSACGAPLAVQAEASYGAELQACVVKARLTDGGRAASKQCEDEVDYRWNVVTMSKDGGVQ